MRAGISLGSNLEPRLLALREACRAISRLHRGSGSMLCSKVYETSPVNCPPGSPHFLNAALEFSTELQLRHLFSELKAIEANLGRTSGLPRNSPRMIDLDLLYFGDGTLFESDLVVPHPRISSRRFVLQPLADIRPELILPNFRKSVRQLLAELKSEDSVIETMYIMS
jgi:2-amino-4-hydroxy-6-hydroxymethyldihydropteridine diphosphokinase